VQTEVIVALIETLPAILAIVGVILLAIMFKKPIEQRIIPRLSGLKAFGVELTLLKESLDEVDLAPEVSVSEGDKWSALKRAQHVWPVIRGARILWVDDQPERNKQLIEILLSFGATVDKALDTNEALTLLRRHQYDVVISDIERQEDDDAGSKMVSKMFDQRLYRWTIFYVVRDSLPDVPKRGFSITNRPDHLLHFVMDVLERERWSDYSAQAE
jgi:hypothetical protein